ncbi:MAG: O-succinylhomoserine sulfhydrylase [Acidimicrobiia bacterium]|nr:O-succinylhomoserine sulfhydrylase [Acidimicrobiia bacterium]MDH5421198.1 O-succinylhomoserine sulfhydrylase [Acidimicrobiia bacterium]MDH5505119.1 O-succinylhomoserine sulfhydrylase [Acidimicrobiia bacterium]
MDSWQPDTNAVRGGIDRTAFEETSEALFLTSGYVYDSAEAAEAAFAGETDRFIYSRYGNPTIRMFEERLRLLEGGEACWATASGMAAVFNALLALVESGDRIVAARGLFGSCSIILSELLPRFGVHTDFVDGTNLGEWEKALSSPTKAVFFETPSNPMLELVDIAAVSELAHGVGATVVIDNVFATPVHQQPLRLGADVVVYSTTKHIDGQGRTLGGAIIGSTEYISEKLQPFMRHTGPSMSPFNAWVALKGLETMRLRVDHQHAAALKVAIFLESRLERVIHPFLASHPQHDLAKKQMSGGGTLITFEVPGGKDGAFALLNRLRLIDISNNLGDAKSLITHPATTTHRRLGATGRAVAGITDGTLRISVGLEAVSDIVADLDQALTR